jgi:glucose/mannose-6-phosphate isomerase
MPALDPTLIDDEDVLARHDSRGVLRSLATAGAQVREAVRLSSDAGIAGVAGGSRPRSVLFAATGGTAIVGDALGWFAGTGSPVPIDTRSHGPLPGWVGSLDLVIAVSQSGRAAGRSVWPRRPLVGGLSLLTVGAPDSPLAAVCASARGVHVDVPTTRTSSRTALWSMLTPVLLAAEALGLAQGRSRRARGDGRPPRCRCRRHTGRRPSLSSTRPSCWRPTFRGTVPVVLGDGPVSGVAARRAAAMLARTARVPATAGELPGAASEVVALLDGPYTQTGAQAAEQPT